MKTTSFTLLVLMAALLEVNLFGEGIDSHLAGSSTTTGEQ